MSVTSQDIECDGLAIYCEKKTYIINIISILVRIADNEKKNKIRNVWTISCGQMRATFSSLHM